MATSSDYHAIPKPNLGADPWDTDYYSFVDKVDSLLERRGELASRPSSAPDGAKYIVNDSADNENHGKVFVYDNSASEWTLADRRYEMLVVSELNGVLTVTNESELDSAIETINSESGDIKVEVSGEVVISSRKITDSGIDNVLIEGKNNAVFRAADGLNSDMWTLNRNDNWTFRNLTWDGNKSNQTNQNDLNTQNAIGHGQNTRSYNLTVENCLFRNTFRGAIQAGNNWNGGRVRSSRFEDIGESGVNRANGVFFRRSDDCKVVDCKFDRLESGGVVLGGRPASDDYRRECKIIDCEADTVYSAGGTQSAFLIQGAYDSAIINCIASNVTSSSGSADGHRIEDSVSNDSSKNGCAIIDCEASYCEQGGASLRNLSHNSAVIGGHYHNNGAGVTAAGDDILVTAVNSQNNDGDGIRLKDGSGAFIHGNNVPNNGQQGIDPDAGTASDYTIKNNKGWKTENSGENTQSGDGNTTTFTVAHGLDMTPTVTNVWAESLDATGQFYVSDKTSLDIEITYVSAPPSGTDNLSWGFEARVSA